jgi:hypothetical protein
VPILIPIALLLWIPVSISLLALLPSRRAVVISVIGAWLLLPPASIPLSGLPDYDKMVATTVGVLLGTLIFQPNRLLELRLRWFDLPMLCSCTAPFIASMQNGLGPYDGLSDSLRFVVHWFLPYLIGRIHLGDLEGLRELAVGIVVGGIIYLPAILLEIRLSPFLKGTVYGLYRWEGTRLGGYRPVVFLTTGLELGMWMTAVCLASVWLWRCGALRHIWSLPFGTVFLPILLVFTFLCRATGALTLLLSGLFVLWACTRFNSKRVFYALLLVAPFFYCLRIPNLWSGDNLVSAVEKLDAERAQSLAFRFESENLLIERAMKQPVWGWGGWGRANLKESDGRPLAVTDSIWIIYFGYYGCFGLFTWTLAMLLPPWLFLGRYPVTQWKTAAVGPAAVVAALLGLYTVDCLLNGFVNLVYIVAGGGLICAVPTDSRRFPSIRDSTESNRLPGSSNTRLSQGQFADPTFLPEAAVDSTTALQPMCLIPQSQLARRYRALARALKKRGKSAQAKAMWMHALDLLNAVASGYPDLPAAQKDRSDCANDIAWFLINEPDCAVDDPQLAVRLATQATQANPEAAVYWNTLGAAHYRAGNEVDAITALERSVALTAGGTGFDYVFLALAHTQLGHPEQALHWKTQADLWMEHNEAYRSELSRLHAQARELQGWVAAALP